MALLWPAAVDGGNSGLITPVSTDHRSSVCDSSAFGWRAAQPGRNLSACILVEWIVAIKGQWGCWVVGEEGGVPSGLL